MKNTWKSTKRFYYGYINTPATVDMRLRDNLPMGIEAINLAVPPIDAELRRFERTLFALDRDPDSAWMHNFTSSHSWISGMALIDLEGRVIEQWPNASLKNLDFTQLVNILPHRTTRLLRTYAQETTMGPEIYVAVPILDRGVPARYFVAHFDPRDLFSRAPYSSEIMVAASDVLLWPGKFKAEVTPVVTEDWGNSIRSSTSGTIRNETGRFFWVVRHLGTLRIAFAAPSEGEFPVEPGQMDLYGGFGGFGGTLPPMERWGTETEAGGGVILIDAAPPPPDYNIRRLNEAPVTDFDDEDIVSVNDYPLYDAAPLPPDYEPQDESGDNTKR
jgi:hypothetical protein